MIAIDAKKRDSMYQELIDEDLNKLESMGLYDKMAEY